MLTSRHKLVFKSLVCVIQFFEKKQNIEYQEEY